VSVSVSTTVVLLFAVEVADVSVTTSISWPCDVKPLPLLRLASQASAALVETKWKPSAIVCVSVSVTV
jgi:hypothetical protein